jgi:FkbM family methyltransferase
VDLGVPRAQKAAVIRPLESLISTALRGRLLRESLPFIARELAGRRVVRGYRLRRTGQWLYLQHASPDVYGLDQTFYQGLFEMPPSARTALARIGRPPRALDLGGNIGLFGVWTFSRYPEATLTAFEPDPRNARLLSMTIEANQLEERWKLIMAAVGTHAGEARFAAGEFATSHIVADGNAETISVPLVDVFDYTSGVDLLKVDIEGAEWPILEDPRFAEIDAIVIALDYHVQGCPHDDPHGTVKGLMRRHGFEVLAIPQEGSPGGMVWCWRAPPA